MENHNNIMKLSEKIQTIGAGISLFPKNIFYLTIQSKSNWTLKTFSIANNLAADSWSTECTNV